jgi:large subunit ribosomal protein L24
MKIKKGDNVIVISGKDKGKQGKVSRVFPSKGLITVDGVNLKKKHAKARKQGGRGQIIDKTMPVDISNVMIVDPKTKKPSRVGFVIKDGKKTRIAKKSGQAI